MSVGTHLLGIQAPAARWQGNERWSRRRGLAMLVLACGAFWAGIGLLLWFAFR